MSISCGGDLEENLEWRSSESETGEITGGGAEVWRCWAGRPLIDWPNGKLNPGLTGSIGCDNGIELVWSEGEGCEYGRNCPCSDTS